MNVRFYLSYDIKNTFEPSFLVLKRFITYLLKFNTVKLTLALSDTFHLTESILAPSHHRIQVPKVLGTREILSK